MGKLAVGSYQSRGRLADIKPFTPKQIAGLAAWWDGDDPSTITTSGSNVTAWADKAGLQTTLGNLGGTGPTTGGVINGHGIIQYTSSSNHQLGSTAPFIYALGDQTTFVVGADSNGNCCFVGEGRSTNTNGSYFVGSLITTKVSRFYHETNTPTTLFDRQGTSVSSGKRITIVDTTTNAKITDSGGGSSNVNYTRGTFSPVDRFGVGCLYRVSSVSARINGWIAEIIVYDHALTADEIALVEAYLNAKWAV